MNQLANIRKQHFRVQNEVDPAINYTLLARLQRNCEATDH